MRTVLVPDVRGIQRLATSAPQFASVIEGSRCVPILTTSQEQLILAREGAPIMAYRVSGAGPKLRLNVGMEAIRNYVGSAKQGDHIVMLYDDPKLARSVEFQYIKDGLEKGEHCKYVIAKDDVESTGSIIKQMEESGIKVVSSSNTRNGRLEVRSIDDPSQQPGGFVKGASAILAKIMKGANGPVRMVLHVKYGFRTKEEMLAHSEFERRIHQSFSSHFPGSMLCNHYVGNNNRELFREWTRSMLDSHDCVFLVSSSSGSIASFL